MIRSIAAAAAALFFIGITTATAQTTGGQTLEAVSDRLQGHYDCSLADGGSSLTVASRTTGRRLATISKSEGGVIRMNARISDAGELSSSRRNAILATLPFLNTTLPIGTMAFDRDGALSLNHHIGVPFAKIEEVTGLVIRMIDQALVKRSEILG